MILTKLIFVQRDQMFRLWTPLSIIYILYSTFYVSTDSFKYSEQTIQKVLTLSR